MNQKKTLVVILCMHRCGSSLTARLLQRLGMSLGPFDLGEANESNKYGHFEAQPFVLLNRELQSRQFGFEGDIPDDAETHRRYCETGGRWSDDSTITADALARGHEMIGQLLESGDVCGFKDPRTVLTWPFWQRIFDRLPEVRIVPLALLRGPHEIAMSIFNRSWADRDYAQALDVTAVHFRRMKEILDQWSGPTAAVQFDPQVYPAQVRHAVDICGLNWSDAALAESYDASCRHYEAVPVEHPAQAAFEALAGLPPSRPSVDDMRRLLADAAAREAMLQENRAVRLKERNDARDERDWARYERTVVEHENGRLQNVNTHLQARAEMVPPLETELSQAAYDLALIRSSRTWKVHQAVAAALRVARRNGQSATVNPQAAAAAARALGAAGPAQEK